MKHLQEYIFENIVSIFEAKFDKFTNDVDELFDLIPKFKKYPIIKDFLVDVINNCEFSKDIEQHFIYAEKSNKIKMKYSFLNTIKQLLKQDKYKEIKSKMAGSKKIKLSISDCGEFMETGSGSLNRVSTPTQEIGTCLVFNHFIDEFRQDPEYKLNYETIKNIVAELSSDFDNEWRLSFMKQINTIIQYLMKHLGIEDITHYKLERYGGDAKFKNWEVSREYSNFIGQYTKCLGGQKDNWDPADVLLYNIDKQNEIISDFKQYTKSINDENSASIVKKEFIKKYYLGDSHDFKGISLKKIALSKKQGNFDVFNIGENNKVANVKCESVKQSKNGNDISIICSGDFKFNNIIDSSNDKIEEVNKNPDYIKIQLRSFGGGQIGIDCTLTNYNGKNNGPSLGKCPIRVWSKAIGYDQNSKDLNSAINKLKTKIDDNKFLEDIIKSAIKEGPNCFPFILIH